MRFEIRQSFRSAADTVDEAYADPDLYPTLIGLPNLGKIEVVSHERTGDRRPPRGSLRLRPRVLRRWSRP